MRLSDGSVLAAWPFVGPLWGRIASKIVTARSTDGGLNWSTPTAVWDSGDSRLYDGNNETSPGLETDGTPPIRSSHSPRASPHPLKGNGTALLVWINAFKVVDNAIFVSQLPRGGLRWQNFRLLQVGPGYIHEDPGVRYAAPGRWLISFSFYPPMNPRQLGSFTSIDLTNWTQSSLATAGASGNYNAVIAPPDTDGDGFLLTWETSSFTGDTQGANVTIVSSYADPINGVWDLMAPVGDPYLEGGEQPYPRYIGQGEFVVFHQQTIAPYGIRMSFFNLTKKAWSPPLSLTDVTSTDGHTPFLHPASAWDGQGLLIQANSIRRQFSFSTSDVVLRGSLPISPPFKRSHRVSFRSPKLFRRFQDGRRLLLPQRRSHPHGRFAFRSSGLPPKLIENQAPSWRTLHISKAPCSSTPTNLPCSRPPSQSGRISRSTPTPPFPFSALARP